MARRTAELPLGKIYLLETLTADISLAQSGAASRRSLSYDDAPPFLDADLKPMPYCLIDPRNGGALETNSSLVLGTNFAGSRATSCIVEASQTVTSLAGVNVHVVYKVYTAYDGGRQIGLG